MPVAVLLAALAGLIVPAGAAASATAPVLAGAVSDATNLSATVSVAVSGNYAYTTAYHAGELTAVDISNPSSPVIAGESAPFLDTNLIGGSNVAIAGGYAFVVSKNRNLSQMTNSSDCTTGSNDDGNGNSLTILDIHTDPAHPAIVGTIRDTGKLFGSYGVAVSGNYAYVAYQGLLGGQPCRPDTSQGGFTVVDITSVGGPKIVANLDSATLPSQFQGAFYHSTSVQITGTTAYVTAFYGARVTVVDISTPTSPRIVASLHDGNNLALPADLAVQGHYVYVANQTSGTAPQFTVLDVSNPATPTVVSTITNSTLLGGAYRIRVHGDFAYISASSANTMAVIDISDPTHPRIAGTLTDSGHLHRTTGLDLDTSGAYVVTSSPYLATESNTTYPPYPLQQGGPTATGTISVIQLDPTPISVQISSGPASLTAQTSATFAFAASDSVAAFTCQLDAGAAVPCSSPTGQSYSGLAVGDHTFTVQATDAAGNVSSATWTWQIGTPPSPSGGTGPTLDAGPATVGQTVNVTSPGTWNGSPAPTYTYQWERCDQNGANCSAIGGQTGTSYVVQQADAGSTLEVVVTATNGLGVATASSSPTAIVTGGAPPQPGTPGPSISGTATQGGTLTASPGSWSGTPQPTFAYQWRECTGGQTLPCPAIPGATAATYLLQSSDVGTTVYVEVTGTNSLGSATATSSPTPTVTGPPINQSPPAISGTAAPGNQLISSPGTWSGYPTPALAYQWEDCNATCSPIAGATGSTYTVQSSDDGYAIQLRVTGSNSVQQNVPATSNALTVNYAPQPGTPGPSISGTATQGATLTASPGSWSGTPSPTFAYQWNRCNTGGTACSAISGASASTYVLQRADMTHTVLVKVTATNSQGSATAASPVTAIVTGPPVNTSVPTVSGTPVQGNTLTGTLGTWTGYPTPTLSAQWQRCTSTGCANIAGATSTSYVLTAADVGAQLRIAVVARNSAGSAIKTSGVTAKVSATATITVHGVRHVRAVVGISVKEAGTERIVELTPAHGLRFVSSNRTLHRDITVRGAGNRRLAVRLTRRGGKLEFRVRESELPLRILVAAGAVTRAGRAMDVRHVARTSSGGHAAEAGAPAGGTRVFASLSLPQPSGSPPTPDPSAPPTVGGTRTQGATLAAGHGGWSGSPYPSFSYQWERCDSQGTACAPIAGAGAATYVLQRADVGMRIVVEVTGTNASGSATASSSPTRIISGPPLPLAAPAISGRAMQGSALSATYGTWSGYPAPSLAIEWQRCTTARHCVTLVRGQTRYVVTLADIGYHLRVSVRADNGVSPPALSRSTLTARARSNATVAVRGVRGGHPQLRLSVLAAGGRTLLREVDIELPSVMRFAAGGLPGAVTVRDGHNRLVRATVSIRSGRLLVRLPRGYSAIRISVDAPALVVKQSFARSISARHRPKVTVLAKVIETRGLHTYDALAVRVS